MCDLLKSSEVYLEVREDAEYPAEDLNPGVAYPEYPFTEKGMVNFKQRNDTYDMIRNCLFGYGYDSEHFGSKEWNPLGTIIYPGQTVVVKPNLVMNKNENTSVTSNAMECLVTHPSCIRAICDYCLIALDRKGRIIIGDAPMQGCDFDDIVRKLQLSEIVELYRGEGIDAELLDFRQYQSMVNHSKVITGKIYTEQQGILVQIGKKSQHYNSNSNGKYQVTDYDIDDTISYHKKDHHDYEIAKSVLEADVIIDLCKPKTHRLAGFTGAMKNLVGVVYDKASLPHRSCGALSEGGDSYQYTSILKQMSERLLDKKAHAEKHNRIVCATVYRCFYLVTLVVARAFSKDKFYMGSWYGNDTIWRTIFDLHQIVMFADKEGKMRNTQQRKMLCIGDMIIAGEHNGPVKPEPKKLGIVMISDNAICFDMALCKMMGFSFDDIPLCRAIERQETSISYCSGIVCSNCNAIQGRLDKLEFPKNWKFKPHDAWCQ